MLVLMRGSVRRGSTWLGLHKGLAEMCRDTWGMGLLPRLRAAGTGKTKADNSKEKLCVSIKKSTVHSKYDSRTALAN